MKFNFIETKVTTGLFAAVFVTALLVGGISRIADAQYENASAVAAKQESQQTLHTAKIKSRLGARTA